MFVGHCGPGFVAKRLNDSIPLWVLFIAAQWLDIVWCTLVLLGINKVQILGGSAEHEKDAGETGAIRNARSSTVRAAVERAEAVR
jgi:hypothetical protein